MKPKTCKLPKTLKLNLETWRCGGKTKNPANRLGKGATYLKNNQGYKCCLGFFCNQSGLKDDIILDTENPADLNIKIGGLTKPTTYGMRTTSLTDHCIDINDNRRTSVLEKIKQLRIILNKYGYKLEVNGLKKYQENLKKGN